MALIFLGLRSHGLFITVFNSAISPNPIHEKLIPLFEQNTSVNEIQKHSENLALLSAAALRKIKGESVADSVEEISRESKVASRGTLLSVADALLFLINNEF